MALCHLRELWSWPGEELTGDVLALTEEKGWREFMYWCVYVVVGPCHSLQSSQPLLTSYKINILPKVGAHPCPALITL